MAPISDSDLPTMGANFREARQRLGLSQTTVAVAAGIDLRTYQQLEYGKHRPDIICFARIVQKLGLRFDTNVFDPNPAATAKRHAGRPRLRKPPSDGNS